MIFKDVVHYVDHGDKRTDFLDRMVITVPTTSPSQPKKPSIPSMNGAAHANTAWNTINIMMELELIIKKSI
jgi:hypothetical protein